MNADPTVYVITDAGDVTDAECERIRHLVELRHRGRFKEACESAGIDYEDLMNGCLAALADVLEQEAEGST